MSIYQLQTFNPATTASGSIDTKLSGPCGVLYLMNESLESIVIARDADFTQPLALIPALWALPFAISRPPSAVWYKVISSQNAEDTTLQQVQGMAYSQEEDTSKLYSGPLPRIANVGNPGSVSPIVTGATSISNTGNPPATPIITVAPSDVASGSYTIQMSSDGSFSIWADNAGVLTRIFEVIGGASPAVNIGAATLAVKIIGGLTVEGSNLNSSGMELPNGSGVGVFIRNAANNAYDQVMYGNSTNDLHIKPLEGSSWLYLDDGNNNNVIQVQPTNIQCQQTITAVNGINYNIGRIKEINRFSGSGGNGSVSTGLSGTPTGIAADPSTQSGGSQTIGLTNAQTATVTTGFGQPWQAMAWR